MKPDIIVRPEAESDIRKIFYWHEERLKGLGNGFLQCVDAVISSLTRFPDRYPPVYKSVRRALIHKFPYGIFYILENGKIIILAVLHMRRDPRYWPRG